MATPAALRRSTGQLVGYAKRDLNALWREVSDAAQARTALMDILPALVETYGTAAATLAATWYDDARAKAAVKGTFEAIPIEANDRGAQALAGWATETATSVEALQTLVLGGLQRRIADHSRLTIMDSSIKDPRAKGWRRVGDGSSCDFCSMLLERGAVYREDTADFTAHDHCGCWSEPDWS